MSIELERAPEGTPVRWQCRYRRGRWEQITKRRYNSLLGNWDYELRTINVVQKVQGRAS